MSFEKINFCDQYKKQTPNFDIVSFNKDFEDSMLLSKISTAESISYDMPNKKTIVIDKGYIDPKLTKGRNFTNPMREDFIDPNQDSPTRLVIVCAVNKFDKTICVMLNDQQYRFWVPGGKPKIVEEAKHAGIRIFKDITGLELNPEKVKDVYKTKDIDVFLTINFDKDKMRKDVKMSFIPLDYLRFYPNQYFSYLYKMMYLRIMNDLY